MGFDAIFFAVAVPAVLIAGLSKGGFASGAGFLSTPLLAVAVGPVQALGIMLPLLVLIDLATLRPYWRRWDWPSARLLLIGAVPGTALGIAIYRVADADLLRVLIGAMAVAFVLWQGARAAGLFAAAARPYGPAAGVLAGTIGGCTSFISHSGGPPVAMFLLSRRLDKTAYQATTVIAFTALNLLKVVPYGVLGVFTAQTWAANLILAPVALLGAWAGVVAHRVVPERAFFLVTYVLLLGTGLMLLWDGLT